MTYEHNSILYPNRTQWIAAICENWLTAGGTQPAEFDTTDKELAAEMLSGDWFTDEPDESRGEPPHPTIEEAAAAFAEMRNIDD